MPGLAGSARTKTKNKDTMQKSQQPVKDLVHRIIRRFVKSVVPKSLLSLHQLALWQRRKFVVPAPFLVKKQVLCRENVSNATWVETGTYMGDMTRELAKTAKRVFTIEPEPSLHKAAAQRFLEVPNVSTLFGTSEEVMPEVLPEVESPVRFWLDGHYSAGGTFRGNRDTPIREELQMIGAFVATWDDVIVYIDDVRCFDSANDEYEDYPTLSELVDWAQIHGLGWGIEQDIFIARKK